MTPISDHDVDRWLDAFAACVRDRDLARGRTLFDDAAAGFGTVAGTYVGLAALVEDQWSDVWTRTIGFTFDDADHRWFSDDLCAVAATWHSEGDDPDRRPRAGRATLVLRRAGAELLAVHSHFSMTPGTHP